MVHEETQDSAAQPATEVTSLRSEILGADDRPLVEVTDQVPQAWVRSGRKLFLQVPEDPDLYLDWEVRTARRMRPAEGEERDPDASPIDAMGAAELIVLMLRDEAGRLVFEPRDAPLLSRKHAGGVNRLGGKCLVMIGFGGKAIEDLAGN